MLNKIVCFVRENQEGFIVLAVIVVVILSFCDQIKWHSAWSYSHDGAWHECHTDVITNKTSCLEGDVTLNWKK